MNPPLFPIADRYYNGVYLGEGAMGEVYRARDYTLSRDVAIKFMNWSGETARSAFLTEAQALAQFNHPNVVQVYDILDERDPPCLIQEYVSGQDLAQVLYERPMGRLPWREVLSLFAKLARGLAAVHGQGVLHRDIKPGNIMLAGYLGDQGTLDHHFIDPKLIDFGVALMKNARDADKQTDDDGAGSDEVLGTPGYLAPELEEDARAATPASDVYAFGVVMYRACAGRMPSRPRSQSPDAERHLSSLSRKQGLDVDPRLAEIVDTCLAHRVEDRYADGASLSQALDELLAQTHPSVQPEGYPFRGLEAFHARHRHLFFGRNDDIARVVERLKDERLVCVHGRSGMGKSSLVRAGVLPAIEEHGLHDGRSWRSAVVTLGKHPLRALAAALGEPLGVDRTVLVDKMRSSPTWLGDHARRSLSSTDGLVLCVDQLEELVTLAPDNTDRERAIQTLASLVERAPGIRVVATLRTDKFGELAELRVLGEHIQRSNIRLDAIAEHNIRSIIVRPVLARGYDFESSDTIDEMVQFIKDRPAGLPLLQFALAELWSARDQERRLIPADALQRIDGVAGALAKHADSVVDTLARPHDLEAAKAILVQLTANKTRTHFSRRELVADSETRARVLDHLVENRLVVTREIDDEYEIAHEVLIHGWSKLRRWIDERGGLELLEQRVRERALEWHENGRKDEYLLEGPHLREADALDADALEPAIACDYLRRSRRKARIKRYKRQAMALSVVLLVAAIYSWFYFQEQARITRELESQTPTLDELVDERLPALEREWRAVMDVFQSIGTSGRRSGHAFDDAPSSDEEMRRLLESETRWQHYLDEASNIEPELTALSGNLRLLLQRDPEREDVQAALMRSLRAQARLTYRLGHDVLYREAVAELERYDRAHHLEAAWNRDIRVSLAAEPSTARVSLCRYRDERGEYVCEPTEHPREADGTWLLPSGSYAFVFPPEASRPEIRVPFVLEPVPISGRDEAAFDVTLPDEVPEGFVFVHGGAFLFGHGRGPQDEAIRTTYEALPRHWRRTDSFIIARHETTFADWLAFLRDQEPASIAGLLPGSDSQSGLGNIQLNFDADAPEATTLDYQPATADLQSYALGEPVLYPGRGANQVVDWRRMPVTGITVKAAQAYAAWLASPQRERPIPGARLCDEAEWEHAARGADGRIYPHGERLDVDDANFDKTYGRREDSFGLDPVGSHQNSRSPYGVEDMAGNAWEKTRAVYGKFPVNNRGGSYYHARAWAASSLRDLAPEEHRDAKFSFRICADWLPAGAPKIQ